MQVGEGYSGLYRVRAVNCLGEAECEAEISLSGEGGGCGDDMYLPPLWREKRRLTWRDEDNRYGAPTFTWILIASHNHFVKKCV